MAAWLTPGVGSALGGIGGAIASLFLPSSLRSRFGNDPAAYLDFVSNEENKPEMAKLGLLTPEAEERALHVMKSPEPIREADTVFPT